MLKTSVRLVTLCAVPGCKWQRPGALDDVWLYGCVRCRDRPQASESNPAWFHLQASEFLADPVKVTIGSADLSASHSVSQVWKITMVHLQPYPSAQAHSGTASRALHHVLSSWSTAAV